MSKLKQIGICYVSILMTYLVVDFIWLGIVSKDEYTTSMGHLMRTEYPIWPWVLFYLVYCACIARLAIFNGSSTNFIRVLSNAFVLGLASYGTYNLTNYAIIDTWPLDITFTDWIWGTCVTTFSAFVGYAVLLWTKRKQRSAI